MSAETDATRQRAFELLEREGIKVTRMGKGQRYVVGFDYEGEQISALVKTASRGGAMARASSDDPDEATLSGFGSDVNRVLFAVANPYNGEVSVYLVPLLVAERAFRENHRAFRKAHPNGKPNTTWVIHFSDVGAPESSGFQRKWASYRIGGRSAPEEGRDLLPPPQSGLSIEEAKAGLAARFGVSAKSIRIIIEQ